MYYLLKSPSKAPITASSKLSVFRIQKVSKHSDAENNDERIREKTTRLPENQSAETMGPVSSFIYVRHDK